MDYADVREMIRIRHELRRLTVQGRREEARELLERLRALAEQDPAEKAEVEPEVSRWEAALSC